jgi:hypothetical protein
LVDILEKLVTMISSFLGKKFRKYLNTNKQTNKLNI